MTGILAATTWPDVAMTLVELAFVVAIIWIVGR